MPVPIRFQRAPIVLVLLAREMNWRAAVTEPQNNVEKHWRFAPGLVDGRSAMLVFDRRDPLARVPVYFVCMDWIDDGIVSIRDFLFARYVLDGAEVSTLT